MNSIIKIIIFLIFWGAPKISVAETLKMPLPRYENDLSHQYHVELLKMALQQTTADEDMPSFEFEFEMSEGRAILELMKGRLIDVYWLGTDKAREQKLRAIPIPTTRGLIGFRKFIIQENVIETFQQIRNVNQLKKYIACQGTNWPDIKILEASHLPVTTTPLLENLYRMIAADRCDYFPRPVHDIDKELHARQIRYPNLISYPNILMHYPFAVYFFTNINHEALAMRIEKGLKILAESGQLLDYMQDSPLTKHVFPLTRHAPSVFLSIPNPTMDLSPQYADHRYWFVIEDFGLSNALTTQKL